MSQHSANFARAQPINNGSRNACWREPEVRGEGGGRFSGEVENNSKLARTFFKTHDKELLVIKTHSLQTQWDGIASMLVAMEKARVPWRLYAATVPDRLTVSMLAPFPQPPIPRPPWTLTMKGFHAET